MEMIHSGLRRRLQALACDQRGDVILGQNHEVLAQFGCRSLTILGEHTSNPDSTLSFSMVIINLQSKSDPSWWVWGFNTWTTGKALAKMNQDSVSLVDDLREKQLNTSMELFFSPDLNAPNSGALLESTWKTSSHGSMLYHFHDLRRESLLRALNPLRGMSWTMTLSRSLNPDGQKTASALN